MGSRNFANTAKRDGLHPAQMLLVASQKTESPKVPPGMHILEYQCKQLIRLAVTDSQELQETAHAKS